MTLPKLKGTDAQVKWAETIRAENIKKWTKTLGAATLEIITGVFDATWWIANRDAATPKMPSQAQFHYADDNGGGDEEDEAPRVKKPTNSNNGQHPGAATEVARFVYAVGSENLLLRTAALALAAHTTREPKLAQAAREHLDKCQAACNAIKLILP